MSLSKPVTIADIKSSPVPNSPQRCAKKLTCAVLNKSPLRPIKNGSMFSLNLCDKDPSSTIRAICFNTDLFSNFETDVTYDLESFKVKKAFGNSSSLELLLDNDTKVSTAASQLKITDHTFNISQILRKETENIIFINLKAKVTSIGNSISVGTYPDNKSKRSISQTILGTLNLFRGENEQKPYNSKKAMSSACKMWCCPPSITNSVSHQLLRLSLQH